MRRELLPAGMDDCNYLTYWYGSDWTYPSSGWNAKAAHGVGTNQNSNLISIGVHWQVHVRQAVDRVYGEMCA
jgi:hypothetical protein